MTLPSFTRRAFLVPILFLATLVGFSQANEASAQSLQGTWEFTWYDAFSGDYIGTATVTVDKKAKSFKYVNLNQFRPLAYGLKINPAKNTFEFLYAEGNGIQFIEGFTGAGTVDLDQGIMTGAGAAFLGIEFVLRPNGPPVVFIGIKQ